MPPRPPQPPKPALPYDRKLITAWKNVGEKAAAKRYASLRTVLHEPGTWEALAATFGLDTVVSPIVPNRHPSDRDASRVDYLKREWWQNLHLEWK